MKKHLISYLTAILLLSTISCAAQKTDKSAAKQSFFTASDASNWIYILKDKSLNPVDVFKMQDGVLEITGASSGYLRTKKVFENCDINLEWRWTKVLGNSGVLVHIQALDTIWPTCYQIQQKANAAGDIICMNGVSAKECTDSVKFTVLKMQPSNEKPLGEWNSMQIISKNNTLKVFVNGNMQNTVTGLTVGKGFIGFQNEGKPVEFRNLSIERLK